MARRDRQVDRRSPGPEQARHRRLLGIEAKLSRFPARRPPAGLVLVFACAAHGVATPRGHPPSRLHARLVAGQPIADAGRAQRRRTPHARDRCRRYPLRDGRCHFAAAARGEYPVGANGLAAASFIVFMRRVAGGFHPAVRRGNTVSTPAKDTTTTIIPSLRYRDALAMIDWLCEAFGFEKHAVYAEGDVVHHAQLAFGNGMVMLGSVDNTSAWGKRIAQPEQIGSRETQACYVVVADCASHCARAKIAGAE